MNKELKQIIEEARAAFVATYPKTYLKIGSLFAFEKGFWAGIKVLEEELAIERSLAIAGTLAAESRDRLAEENADLRNQVSELKSAIAARQERTDYWANRAELAEQELAILKEQIVPRKLKPLPINFMGTLDQAVAAMVGHPPCISSAEVGPVLKELKDKLDKAMGHWSSTPPINPRPPIESFLGCLCDPKPGDSP